MFLLFLMEPDMRYLLFSALLLTGCASRTAQMALIKAVELHNEAVVRLEAQNRRLLVELEQMKVAAAAEKGDVAAAKQSVLSIAKTMEEGMAVRVMMERAKVEMEVAREHTKPLLERLFGWTKGAKSDKVLDEPNVSMEDDQRESVVGCSFDDKEQDECACGGRQVEPGHTLSDMGSECSGASIDDTVSQRGVEQCEAPRIFCVGSGSFIESLGQEYLWGYGAGQPGAEGVFRTVGGVLTTCERSRGMGETRGDVQCLSRGSQLEVLIQTWVVAGVMADCGDTS